MRIIPLHLFDSMKTIPAIIVALWVSTCWTNAQTISSSPSASGVNPGQTAPSATPYAVVSRDANSRVWERTVYESGPSGQAIPRKHRYTELATGLNYLDSNTKQWVESKEEIDILPNGGAEAVQGRHKVYFPSDICNGVLEVVAPVGRHLKSRPLGVSYDDGSNTVFIATLKHAQGWLTSSNTVTYRDAFTGFKADLVCTYRRGGFECCLVFRQQPPAPDHYGLDNANSTLQLVTEFFNTADPRQIPAQTDDRFGLQDNTLKFGALTMTRGKAFAVNSQNLKPSTLNTSTPVFKRWLRLQGRAFLIEEVPLVYLADDLDALPLAASLQKPEVGSRKFASQRREFPPAHELVSDTNQILLASADLNKQPGVVLDYVISDSGQEDFTFQSGVTYYVGDYGAKGLTTFQGGAVIKFNSTGGSIEVNQVACETSPGHPAIFTAMDDDSVGEPIDGSSGTPSGFYGGAALDVGADSMTVHDFRFNHIWQCFNLLYVDAAMSNIEAHHCDYVITTGGDVTMNNCLFYNDYLVADVSGSARGTHLTVHACNTFGGWVERCLTNCLFVTTTNLYDPEAPPDVFTNAVEWLTNDAGVFQTAGAAGHYLAANSPAATSARRPLILICWPKSRR